MVNIIVLFFSFEFPELDTLDMSCSEAGDELDRIFFWIDPQQADKALPLTELQRTRKQLTWVEGNTPIEAINQALSQSLASNADLIIMNGDLVLVQGSMAAILEAAKGDPMTMFLTAGSNKDIIPTLPELLIAADLPAFRAGAEALREKLPLYKYIPMVASVCVYVKTGFLAEIAALDAAFACWENALSELSIRANRYGYRSALVCHAFAYAIQSVAHNEWNLIVKDYKDYSELTVTVPKFLASPERQAESILAALGCGAPLLTAFDFSSFSITADGTNEAGRRILEAATTCWTDRKIAVIASPAVWDAHRLGHIPGIMRIDPDDRTEKTAAVIRIGQPMEESTLPRLFTRAAVVAVFMLDAIAYDCQYIFQRALSVDTIWNFVFQHADVVFTQSQFTMNRLKERFRFGADCLPCITRHSMDLKDYYRSEPSCEGDYVLVVGNNFNHKFVAHTVNRLAAAFPDKKFLAIGPADPAHPNVIAKPAGGFDEETFSRIYLDAEFVIFPSLYEGFGFPVLHALARGKIVYARDSELNRELNPHIRHHQNIRHYLNTDELIALIRNSDHTFSLADHGEYDIDGWKRSAMEIRAALDQQLQQINYDRIVNRLRWCHAIFEK